MVSISPSEGKLQLFFNEGSTLIAENAIDIRPGQEYSFTYIQEGSAGVFYSKRQKQSDLRLRREVIYWGTGRGCNQLCRHENIKQIHLNYWPKGN